VSYYAQRYSYQSQAILQVLKTHWGVRYPFSYHTFQWLVAVCFDCETARAELPATLVDVGCRCYLP